MSKVNIVRAWKDVEYRLSLSDAERALVPDNPAGLIELAEEDLGQVHGGAPDCTVGGCFTLGCGTTFDDSCVPPDFYCP
jgi:mersacidin/lichenicidin family type 2 lantibiotic